MTQIFSRKCPPDKVGNADKKDQVIERLKRFNRTVRLPAQGIYVELRIMQEYLRNLDDQALKLAAACLN